MSLCKPALEPEHNGNNKAMAKASGDKPVDVLDIFAQDHIIADLFAMWRRSASNWTKPKTSIFAGGEVRP